MLHELRPARQELKGQCMKPVMTREEKMEKRKQECPIGATENQSEQTWEKPQCHIAYILDKNAIWDKNWDIMGTSRCFFSDGHGTLW